MKPHEIHHRTISINNKQKHLSKVARHNALQWLARQFPRAFDNTHNIQPLKIGVLNDILAVADLAKQENISKSKLREAVVLYTRRVDYLACIKAKEMRIDLQGNPTEAVTEAEAAHAAHKLKKRVEKAIKNTKKNNVTQQKISGNYFSSTSKTKAPAITVKRKFTKPTDSDAVTRLKEKLGIKTGSTTKKANEKSDVYQD